MNKSKLRLGILVSGRGSNLQAIIDAASSVKIDAGVEVVISDKSQAPALDHARRSRVPAFFLNPKDYSSREKYDEALVDVLRKHKVDLVILAGYMRLITSQLIEPFKNRIINIHPSLLPAFSGLHAHRQALEWGARVSGCTVHFVDESMDQGPIIIQAAVPVYDGDTEETLAARILEEEHRILPQAIQYIAEQRLEVSGRRVIVKSAPKMTGAKILSPMIEIGL